MYKIFKLIKIFLDTKEQNSVGDFLIKNKKNIAIAESCTGGLLSSLLTDVSGSSAYIKANFVTYANEAKIQYLGVKEETLKEYGAVSTQTAKEMVEGLLEKTQCDFAIATTGIAGPSGGSVQKPVGLVYIGVGRKDNISVVKYQVNSSYPRILVKYMFAKQAIKLLNNFIKEEDL